MTQEWGTVDWRAVDRWSSPNAYWLKWSREFLETLQRLPWPPASIWNHAWISPGGRRVLPHPPQSEFLPQRGFSSSSTLRWWGRCFWEGYFSRHQVVFSIFFFWSLIFWFLSFCQGNRHGVTCLLLWCGSCHLAGQVGSQLGWPLPLVRKFVSLCWMWDIRQDVELLQASVSWPI